MKHYSKKYFLPILLIALIPLLVVAQSGDKPNDDQELEVPIEAEEVEVRIILTSEVEKELVKTAQSNNIGGSNYPYTNLFIKYALQHNVDYKLLRAISLCENRDQVANLQSGLKYNFTHAKLGIIKGEPELSYGLAQINLHYNPHVTYEQAIDPDFSINFMAENIAAGRHSMWACYSHGGYKKYY